MSATRGVTRKELIKIVAGENYTPFALARKLDAICILESSSFQKGRERYSLLMIQEAFRVQQDSRGIVLKPADGGAGVEIGASAGSEAAAGGSSSSRLKPEAEYLVKSRARDILDVLLYFANQHQPPRQDFPFPAGGIGYLSFEFFQYCDTTVLRDKPDPLEMPDALFLFGHTFVLFDHYTDLLYLIGLNYNEKSIDLEEALAELERRIAAADPPEEPEAGPAARITGDDAERDYMSYVTELKKEIFAGNLLQAVPSRRLQFKTDLSGIEAYRRLRRTNPSPYLFYLNFKDFELFGASPEVHCKVKNGKAILRPIAGTRRRGQDRVEDLALESELLADPKERAEHLMLVDLGRNDLGRVCEPGSVHVTDYMVIERYSHVMHIVSQVEGRLEPGKTGADALRATFPAGTVSGAPKIQAIKTIDALEPVKRRFYAGVVGYFEPGGSMDTCIAIRSAVKKDGVLTVQAGGGIVYDSEPERELQETNEKLGAMLRSIGADETGRTK